MQRMGKTSIVSEVYGVATIFSVCDTKETFQTNSYLADEQRGQQWILHEDQLTKRCTILKKYVDAGQDQERQVLYALQHMMHELEYPNSKFNSCGPCPSYTM